MTELPDDLRVARHDDLAAVRVLCETALTADARPGEVAALFLHRLPDADRLVLVAEADRRVVAVAAAAVRTRAKGRRTGHLDLIAVAGDARRAGLGRRLVHAAQSWAAGRGAKDFWWGADAPVYAWPGIDDDYLAARALAEASGARPAGAAVNCTVDLAAADLSTTTDEARLAAAGIQVERLAPAQVPQLLAWVDTFGGTWSAEAAAAAGRWPAGCHVARRGSSYIGFAGHGSNRSDWFGPMGTAESERGQGVGVVLLRRCLADQRDAGLAEAQIAWVGPVDFYARTVGARVGRHFTLFRQDLPAADASGEEPS